MYRVLLLVLLTGFTLSCQSKKENTEKQTPSPFERERAIFFSNLKTQAEVALLIHQSKLDFDASLLNDPNLATQYVSNGVKAAANLGVYLADLNYCIAYKQDVHMVPLFTASHELSQSIGIEQGILEFLKKRYNGNIAQDDSVKAVIEELFTKTTNSLKGTINENLIGIAMAAYEIENLHIVLGLIERHQNDSLSYNGTSNVMPLYKVALDQRQRVEIIYGFLKSITDPLDPNQNPNFPYYTNAFETLIVAFQKANIQNQNDSEFVNKSSVKELNESVNSIRDKIVSNR